jgi:hypothetical protein
MNCPLFLTEAGDPKKSCSSGIPLPNVSVMKTIYRQMT